MYSHPAELWCSVRPLVVTALEPLVNTEVQVSRLSCGSVCPENSRRCPRRRTCSGCLSVCGTSYTGPLGSVRPPDTLSRSTGLAHAEPLVAKPQQSTWGQGGPPVGSPVGVHAPLTGGGGGSDQTGLYTG